MAEMIEDLNTARCFQGSSNDESELEFLAQELAYANYLLRMYGNRGPVHTLYPYFMNGLSEILLKPIDFRQC
jgi:hypothetical protein